MSTTHLLNHDQLVRNATGLTPLLREKAPWSDLNRRLHDDVIEALADAGVFRMRTPERFGGLESSARTLVEVAAELARGDGSASWVATVYWIPSWIVGQFPEHVQEEVFSTPDVRVCGTLSPSATATRTSGGIVINGHWGFVSGAWHSHWQEMSVMLTEPDGSRTPVMALAPMSQLEILDDWHTAGLRGSGSITTVARDLFVPSDRVLPADTISRGDPGSDSPVYRVPLLAAAAASAVGVAVGLARGARDAFFERLPGRKITYTDYASQREAPVTHLQVADAVMKLDESEFHALRLADAVDTHGAGGLAWTLEERARARADQGMASRLAKQSIDILYGASGGSALYCDKPIQRIARDIQGVCLHALINPDTSAELYGRVLCGLEPNTHHV